MRSSGVHAIESSRVQDLGSSGVDEFMGWRVLEFRRLGDEEFKSSRVQELGNYGVQEIMSSRVREFRSFGSLGDWEFRRLGVQKIVSS